jgi:hypothetical protein
MGSIERKNSKISDIDAQILVSLTNFELSRTPAIIPAMKEAQLKSPMSAGTDTKVLVIGATSPIISGHI